MNEKLKAFSDKIKNKKVAVIGFGISNRPLIHFLLKYGASVVVYDKREKNEFLEHFEEFSKKGVEFVFGEGYLDNLNEEIIFKTPGMRYDVPQLEKARKAGSLVTSEMEVFFDICPAKIIAVTGSDGKTTTTTLIYNFLKQAGLKVRLGGNIGTPLIHQVDTIDQDEWIVLELSSFQLHTMKKSPHIAVITNITPNHLDYHKDYQEYIDAKKNIMLYQDENDILVTNAFCEDTKNLKNEAKGKVRTFSLYKEADISFDGENLVINSQKLFSKDEIKVPGMHNIENYMAAILATQDIVPHDIYQKVANTFTGVEHRIELVRVIDNVRYYNSSIDSSPNRSINTLRVFKDNVVMIAGGKDKKISYDDLGPEIVSHVKTLILIGMTADVIEESVKKADHSNKVKIIRVNSYKEAVDTAKNNAKSGDVVLLSPASTSFDMFQNFEQRGNLFKELVNNL